MNTDQNSIGERRYSETSERLEQAEKAPVLVKDPVMAELLERARIEARERIDAVNLEIRRIRGLEK